jgi:hypothetical protein
MAFRLLLRAFLIPLALLVVDDLRREFLTRYSNKFLLWEGANPLPGIRWPCMCCPPAARKAGSESRRKP